MNHHFLRKIVNWVLITIIATSGALVALAQEEGNDTENSAESVAQACAQGQEPLSAEDIPLSALADLDMTFSELQGFLAEGGNLYDLLPEGGIEQTAQARALACIEALAANGDLNAEQAAALRAVIESGANAALREALRNHATTAGSWGHDHAGGMLGRRGRLPGWRARPFAIPRGLKPSDDISMGGQFGFRITRDEDGNWHMEEYGDSGAMEMEEGEFDESMEFFGDIRGFALPFVLLDEGEFFDEFARGMWERNQRGELEHLDYELLEMLMELFGRRGGRFAFPIPTPDDIEGNGNTEKPSEEPESDEEDHQSEGTDASNSSA